MKLFRKLFITAVLVTAMCGSVFSLSTAATEFETAPPPQSDEPYVYAPPSTPYVLGTKVSGKLLSNNYDYTYSFTLTKTTTIIIHEKVTLPGGNVRAYLSGNSLYNSKGIGGTAFDFEHIYASGVNNKTELATRDAELKIVYKNLEPATYYFNIGTSAYDNTATSEVRYQPQLSLEIPFEFTINPAGVTKGAVVPNVTAKLNTAGAINVSWGVLPAERYAVYYTYRDNAAGNFGNWGTAAVEGNNYTIPNAVKNATYYVTVLPFCDYPSRQYGGFSPYAQVLT